MADEFGRPDEGEYKVVTVSQTGRITETYYRGWNAETAADTEWRAAKEDARIRYAVIFVGGGIRWEYPKLEPVPG